MRFGDIIRDMRAAPLVRVAVPLLLGITWQTQVPLAVPMLPVCLVLAALLPLVHSRIRHYAWRWVFGGVLYGFLWCAGMVLVQQRPQHSALPLGQPIYLWAIVEQERTPGESVVKYTLQVQAMADSTGALQRVQERIVVYLRPTHGHPMPAYADGLVLHTTLSRIPPPANPEEFDYARYLARQGIFVSAFIDARQYWITAHRQAPQPRAWFVELRQQLLHFFERQGLDEEQLAVLQALTLGDKSLLDADLRQSYAAAGAMHILAVSGMHVGIIAMILGWVLSPLARYRYGRLARGVVLLTLLWMYALLAGLSPSVVRATIMFSVLTLGQMQGTPTNVYNNVAFAALVICLANPYALLDAGFQLSFAAVLSIVAFYPRIAVAHV